MSSEILTFVNKLLETPPGKPHSIQLEIDTDGDIPAFFEVLLMIMTEVLKRWYAPPISISKISDEDLIRLVGYFASFGIDFKLAVEPEPRVLAIRNRTYIQQSRLEEMKFQVAHNARLYTVRFSTLPIT
jgi:hypothetical protein